jgi:pyrroline-5-carboxylate reductase
MVSAGASGVCAGETATEADVDYVAGLFGCLGRAVVVDESDMDTVCALSGSGPAYVAAMIESLRDAAAAEGLDPQLAETLALQTVLGTAQFIAETGITPENARIAVCSPGGTTLAALDAMNETGFDDVFAAGVRAAVRRSKELAQCSS